MKLRGVRGAITVESDTPETVLAATRKLLRAMITANAIDPDDVASVFLTTTPDLTAVFPAVAARQLGWLNVPLMGAQEAPIAGALPRCVRILIHLNTAKRPEEIQHVYLGGAVNLRGPVPPLPEDELE
ncbi:MAG: chorismate mutase [Chloroflexi bacterium]|nr:chorismate mutase [Chloroflexota bacterium]